MSVDQCLNNSASKLVVENEGKKLAICASLSLLFHMQFTLKTYVSEFTRFAIQYKISGVKKFEFLHPMDVFRFGAALQNNLTKKYLFS